MSYFPAFFQLEGKRILLVGGGHIAAEKLEKLLDFCKEITIVAAEVSEPVATMAREHCLTLLVRPYRSGEALEYDLVIVATDTVELHRQIFEETRKARVLVNSVDDTRYCDFIFPSYVKRGDLTVAFSTSGASPAFARQIRRWFEQVLPEGVEGFLAQMRKLRSELPKGKERMERFERMAKEYVKENFPSLRN
ncbi:precorrin-2 dehydrogenase/sirohydrochlorin ferrochelatase family protein [Nitratifractor salsuginis]|uniref:precorrin-2 dehydrogenase n=1 Tax=Nitratifractor salsuginis (strain DSM 16511 / JCM 12458 / E9I37-1) TaxID=749222 RepID=E6X0J8_NITSE|nr:bifunctional precorrin-2 dehydrogenase/sirohydrochlorin ferrochelatase [Nitratifractor salsuginis]ADV46848.1 siroheme synthase [Nitratifractor salsuginis DSM 16511]